MCGSGFGGFAVFGFQQLGNKRNVPLIDEGDAGFFIQYIGSFHQRQKWGEIPLHVRQVHFIEDQEMRDLGHIRMARPEQQANNVCDLVGLIRLPAVIEVAQSTEWRAVAEKALGGSPVRPNRNEFECRPAHFVAIGVLDAFRQT